MKKGMSSIDNCFLLEHKGPCILQIVHELLGLSIEKVKINNKKLENTTLPISLLKTLKYHTAPPKPSNKTTKSKSSKTRNKSRKPKCACSLHHHFLLKKIRRCHTRLSSSNQKHEPKNQNQN